MAHGAQMVLFLCYIVNKRSNSKTVDSGDIGLDAKFVNSETNFKANTHILSDSEIVRNTLSYTDQGRMERKVIRNEITVNPTLDDANQFQ